MSKLIGEIHCAVLPYYDSKLQKLSFKKRPVLIISDMRNNDYVVLPISTIKNVQNVDCMYDIPIALSQYPKIGLDQDSYVRTHKQTTVHRGDVLCAKLGDIKNDYPELFEDIMLHLSQFNETVFNDAFDDALS